MLFPTSETTMSCHPHYILPQHGKSTQSFFFAPSPLLLHAFFIMLERKLPPSKKLILCSVYIVHCGPSYITVYICVTSKKSEMANVPFAKLLL